MKHFNQTFQNCEHIRNQLNGFGRISTRTRPLIAVEGVVGIPLVAHLVGHVIDVERITDGLRQPSDAKGLVSVPARNPQIRDPSPTGGENMANVLVLGPDHRRQVELMLGQHGAAV